VAGRATKGAHPLFCRICELETPGTRFEAREQMYGMGGSFRYVECGSCGSVQIEEIPRDLSKYYRSDYYSYKARPVRFGRGRLRDVLRRIRDRGCALGSSGMPSWLARLFPDPILSSVGKANLHKKHRVLDVGCGSGNLLRRLSAIGVQPLLGIDPLLPTSSQYEDRGFRLRCAHLADVRGEFDLIMFHHSLEHLPNPNEALGSARRLLAKGGVCLVRMPTVSSDAWEKYREDWVQLDAPRHLHLYSRLGFERSVRRLGYRIRDIRDDSTGMQFWGSEQCRMGIPLESDESVARGPKGSRFTQTQISEFERRAQALNQAGRGDQFAAYLERDDS
jgi:SAM-dependent methyltransferase